MLFESIKKFFRARAAKGLRHETLNTHIVQIDFETDLTSQDNQFAGDVHSRKIVARIGLSESLIMSSPHDCGKGLGAVERVEEVRERAGKNSFDANYGVARVEQIAERVNDRQPRTDVRFVKKISAGLSNGVAQF